MKKCEDFAVRKAKKDFIPSKKMAVFPQVF
jgi:hypothetical protein